MNEDQWRAQLLEHRRVKDRAFAGDERSPIPLDERADFDGLAYYEPDVRYRFELELDDGPVEEVAIRQTAGGEVTYRRVGTFTLELPDGSVTLAAFEHEPGADRLWVPFYDETNGDETYEHGRYVEAYPIPEDVFLVDLNLAYHPFCAYNETFTCALPPKENTLGFPLRVGERYPE